MKLISFLNSYELGKKRRRDIGLFLLMTAVYLAFGIKYQICANNWVYADAYVTTLLSFSYLKYGFFRRGLAGTLFDIVCRLIPSARSVSGAIWFMWGMNVIYFASLLLFAVYILKKLEDGKVFRGAFVFMLICLEFLIPSACVGHGALGRADLLQIAINLLQIYLIIEMKHEWLTVLLSAVNTLFHEGYVLMTFCAVMIVLLYRAGNTEGKKGKYWLLFGLNVAAVGAVAGLSVTVGSRGGTPEIYREAFDLASSLQAGGSVHYNLISSMARYSPENGPFVNDAAVVAAGMRELPVFLLCFIPVLLVFGRGLVGLFVGSKKDNLALHITAVLLGPVLIGVEYLKYCDYGRYILWLVFYYFIVFTVLAVLGDQGAKRALSVSFGYKNLSALLILLLFKLYQPIPTNGFTNISVRIARALGRIE